MSKIYEIVVIGAGARGHHYSQHPRLNPIAVIEPNKERRDKFATKYSIEEDKIFSNLEELPECSSISDQQSTIALITTSDSMHKECCRVVAEKNYKIVLLEKPMATNLEDCQYIVDLFNKHKIVCSVFHVLRGAFSNHIIKNLIKEKKLGHILNVRHLEPVGHLHYAHSFVRGNWHKEADSSNFLLAKCCHDLDLIHWWFGEDFEIESIFSTGSLSYFHKGNRPKEVPENVKFCKDCPIKESCVYSAIPLPGKARHKYYTDEELSTGSSGGYGNCVYNNDNDVMDNQDVLIKYKNGGPNVNFSVIATTQKVCTRKTEIYGSFGEIYSDSPNSVTFNDFRTGKVTEYKIEDYRNNGKFIESIVGHGGVDGMFVDEIIKSIETGEVPSCNPNVTLVSHKMVFAAERSRKGRKIVVDL